MPDSPFIGRARYLEALRTRAEMIERDGRGAAVALRGRRQVGKSRLVQRFCEQSALPYVYFQADRGMSPVESIARFVRVLRESGLPAAAEVPDDPVWTWRSALQALEAALPVNRPAIVVLDELPWLMEQDKTLEGVLQTEWDRSLSRHPVLLILVGSDLRMMESFSGYDSPFYGRADPMLVEPLDPGNVAQMTGLSGADALDAHLMTGGFPGLCRAWPDGMAPEAFIRHSCENPYSPLFTMGEVMLASEFPAPDQHRRVLTAIGSGERSFANIGRAAGSGPGAPVQSGSLGPILRTLEQKQVIAVDQPLAVGSSNGGKLYRVRDTYLRLHLSVLSGAHEDIKRGRPELAVAKIQRQWSSWRGRAIEPVIREALYRSVVGPDFPWPEAEAVGGWWPRNFDPEIDLVGADRGPVAKHLFYTGSIKWLGTPFDGHDLADLTRGSAKVPGADPAQTGLVVVSLSGTTDEVEADLVWGAEEVLAAWES